MPTSLTTPISDTSIRALHVGDSVLLSGTILTARDSAHRWIHDRFISHAIEPSPEDINIHAQLQKILQNSMLYHCGPIVRELDGDKYEFISAGPTTSMRAEPYQADLIRHFNLKGVIGKGGMGEKTLEACGNAPAVYLHAVGGAAALIARSVKRVLGVLKLEFGVPEAMWIIQVVDFPAVVSMDSHHQSLHKEIHDSSLRQLKRLTKL